MLGESTLKQQRRAFSHRTVVFTSQKPRKAVAVVNREGVLSIKHNLGPKWSKHRFGSRGLNAFDRPTFWSFYQSCRNKGYDEFFCAKYAKETLAKTLGKENLQGLRPSQYGLPKQRKYPLNTCGRAKNAKGRATQMLNQGYITQAQHREIFKRANRAQNRLC